MRRSSTQGARPGGPPNRTRTTVDVVFPADTAPGSKVWICAFWFNPRTQAGPTSAPVSTNLPGGTGLGLAA